MTQKALRVVISGRVQGVGYRAWTERSARKLGLNGWVRNRKDGSVEAVFSGEEALLARMLEQCKSGPMLARVSGIEQFSCEDASDDFICLPTV